VFSAGRCRHIPGQGGCPTFPHFLLRAGGRSYRLINFDSQRPNFDAARIVKPIQHTCRKAECALLAAISVHVRRTGRHRRGPGRPGAAVVLAIIPKHIALQHVLQHMRWTVRY
jgi:hypothetical protein